ncbi:MAG: T9SS type A sorting domain-containing protein [Saprospiraceae bacterium]
MRFPNISTAVLAAFFLLGKPPLPAQTVIFSEDFNACNGLPAGWQAHINGYQDALWYVGTATNSNAPGQSIDGSCCLIIDDDGTGEDTPGFVADFVSPAFDASQFSTVALTLDVHYRDWNEADESFKILLWDGTQEIELAAFDNDWQTGNNFFDYVTLRYDLAFITRTTAARLIIRYDDADEWNWWAAVDNIKVTGTGQGTNILAETFNACSLPAGWESQILTGGQAWQFGVVDNPNCPDYASTIDGSCMVFFDDDILGQNAPYSVARLASPWFNGADFAKYRVSFDLVHRYYSEIFRVYVQDDAGTETLVQEWGDDVGGPNFDNSENLELDLSAYRAKQMRVVFEFDDGQDWGWWSGLDNVKITGEGSGNDLCVNALSLQSGAACILADNRTALFDGPVAACATKSVAGLWYRWTADFTGTAKFTSGADFNDVLTVFTGSCANPQTAFCHNRDEHGFTGEAAHFQVTNGTSYLLRVSGQDGGFGLPRGGLCARIENAATVPTAPANDDCQNAATLTLDAPCLGGTNLHGATSTQIPSLNELARADVWYKFVAPSLSPTANKVLEIKTNADFSDIITVYRGGCNNLQEVAANHKGGALELPALTAGQTYRVQIAGTFATVEGSLCPQLIEKQLNAPTNDDCPDAKNVPVGGACTASDNEFATFSGLRPPCAVTVEQDVWFKFTAPASGAVRLNAGAEFEHVLAVWSGGCNNLEPVFCAKNPKRCDGFVTVGDLTPGQVYRVQIGTLNGAGTSGAVCLKITNAANPPDFQALELHVQEICNGIGTAEIRIEATNGLPPYTYIGVQNGATLNGGDEYLAVVTDAQGCEISVNGIVDDCANWVGCNLSASLTVEQPRCFGDQNGALTANALDGAEPYTYLWSNSATTQTIANLPAGEYTCTVTDAAGCETVLTQTLTAPALLTATPTKISNPLCFGDQNGSLTIEISGGTSPYGYSWSNGQNTPTATGLAAGVHACTVTDAAGCVTVFSQNLLDPVALTAWVTGSTKPVQGQNNGSIQVQAGGGTGSLTYQWSVGGQPVSAQQNLVNVPGGTYTLVVTDQNGCTTSLAFVLEETVSTSAAGDVFFAEIFPNPTQGAATLSISLREMEDLSLTLTDATGRTLRSWTVAQVLRQQIPLDLSGLPTGVYELRLRAGSANVARKVVVQF